jgi:hypothetical protein
VNLHERLEAAKAERRQRAGLPAEAPEVSPMHEPIGRSNEVGSRPGVIGTDVDEDFAIDLTGYAPIVDLRPELAGRSGDPSFSAAIVVGEGDRCPTCGSESHLDMEDVVGGVDHFSCTNCGLLFQVAR